MSSIKRGINCFFMISFMDYEDKVGSEGFLKICLIIYDNRVALRLYFCILVERNS